MSDIRNCLLKNVYRDLLITYNEDNKTFITSGKGSSFDRTIKFNGSLTSSFIKAEAATLQADGTHNALSVKDAEYVNKTGYFKLPTAPSLPNPTTFNNACGAMVFVNNELWVYGEL